MKKLILILFALILGTMVYSQGRIINMTNSGDTVTDTGTKYVDLDMGTYSRGDLVTIQVLNKKVSGTVAGNTLFQGSIDGINFVNIGTDTLKNANANWNTAIWIDNPIRYKVYRVTSTGTGTMKMTTTGYAVIRRNY